MATVMPVSRGPVFQNHVDGRWVAADVSETAERRNPADRRDLIGRVPFGSAGDVDRAVNAAASALAEWRRTPAPVRGRLLLEVAMLLEQRREQVASIVTREQGKTLVEARGEVDLSVKLLHYMSGEGRRLSGETLPSEHGRRFAYTIRQPLGVVGLITPWNFPLAVPLWKIAPALVCGNTVVWKPSRLTPLTSEAVARLFADAAAPPGVVNLVNGAGRVTGAALTTDPRVRAISFTSSYEVGTAIYSDAARLFKKVQCEAGGKNAVIVLADADLTLAADCIAAGAFGYAGQRCTATSVVVAVDDVADTLAELLTQRARAVKVGNGMDPETTMGPIADELQMGRIVQAIEQGKREARLLCGGTQLTDAEREHGLFMAPTIFDDVTMRGALAQEEIFGPVLAIVRARDFSQAITIANGNRYGMAAAVFSRDAANLLDAAEELDCGIVHFNAPTIGAEVHLPFGGIKHTGVGEREMGSVAVDFYSERKVVYVTTPERRA
jgi:alpha-ketoglutaric semialdehyde dehydrogenase